MFNPQDHLSIVDGAAYLEVKWRLVWLREQHPDATIETDMVESTRDHAIFKAFVRLPNGATATGWGSEYREQFANFIEAAETKAIGRALAALGFGTQFAGEYTTDSGNAGLSDAPVQMRVIKDQNDDQPPYPAAQASAATQMAATDRQRKLVEVLQSQLSLADDELEELATQHGGAALETLGRKGMSSLITELQRIKQDKQDRARAS